MLFTCVAVVTAFTGETRNSIAFRIRVNTHYKDFSDFQETFRILLCSNHLHLRLLSLRVFLCQVISSRTAFNASFEQYI